MIALYFVGYCLHKWSPQLVCITNKLVRTSCSQWGGNITIYGIESFGYILQTKAKFDRPFSTWSKNKERQKSRPKNSLNLELSRSCLLDTLFLDVQFITQSEKPTLSELLEHHLGTTVLSLTKYTSLKWRNDFVQTMHAYEKSSVLKLFKVLHEME